MVSSRTRFVHDKVTKVGPVDLPRPSQANQVVGIVWWVDRIIEATM